MFIAVASKKFDVKKRLEVQVNQEKSYFEPFQSLRLKELLPKTVNVV